MNGYICILEIITDIKNPGSKSMHRCDRNVDSEVSRMCNGTVGIIKTNNLNIRTPICTVAETNFYASEQSFYLIIVSMSELRNFVPSGNYLIGIVTQRRQTFFKCHISKINIYLYNCL